MALTTLRIVMLVVASMAVTGARADGIGAEPPPTLTPAVSDTGAKATTNPPPSAAEQHPAVPALVDERAKCSGPCPDMAALPRHPKRPKAQAETLSADELAAVAAAHRGRGGPIGSEARGYAMVTYGGPSPYLVCSPLVVCVVELQAGEVVRDMHGGDMIRWKIALTSVGPEAQKTPVVVVKPTEGGLRSNLYVATDRRAYEVRLVSDDRRWMQGLRWAYPEDLQRAIALEQARAAAAIAAISLPTGELTTDLDFNYDVMGSGPLWRPVRVYADSAHTYLEFAPGVKHDEWPVLMATGVDGDRLVNYSRQGLRYVVDSVLQEAVLIGGVGIRQDRIYIRHTGARTRQAGPAKVER